METMPKTLKNQPLKENITEKQTDYVSDASQLPKGVLARVTYPIMRFGVKNANNRIYDRSVAEKVMNDPDVQDKLQKRNLFGDSEHPEYTQVKLDPDKTSHLISKIYIDEAQNILKADFDILNTKAGQFIYALLEAGSQVGVSTRAEGDLTEDVDEAGEPIYRVVDNTFKFSTTDFTGDASTKDVLPENLIKAAQSAYESKKIDGNVALMLLERVHTKESQSLVESIKKDLGIALTEDKKAKCQDCGETGLTLDKSGLCHKCWQDRKDAQKNESKIKPGSIVTINGQNAIVNQVFESTGKVITQVGIERKIVTLSECKLVETVTIDEEWIQLDAKQQEKYKEYRTKGMSHPDAINKAKEPETKIIDPKMSEDYGEGTGSGLLGSKDGDSQPKVESVLNEEHYTIYCDGKSVASYKDRKTAEEHLKDYKAGSDRASKQRGEPLKSWSVVAQKHVDESKSLFAELKEEVYTSHGMDQHQFDTQAKQTQYSEDPVKRTVDFSQNAPQYNWFISYKNQDGIDKTEIFQDQQEALARAQQLGVPPDNVQAFKMRESLVDEIKEDTMSDGSISSGNTNDMNTGPTIQSDGAVGQVDTDNSEEGPADMNQETGKGIDEYETIEDMVFAASELVSDLQDYDSDEVIRGFTFELGKHGDLFDNDTQKLAQLVCDNLTENPSYYTVIESALEQNEEDNGPTDPTEDMEAEQGEDGDISSEDQFNQSGEGVDPGQGFKANATVEGKVNETKPENKVKCKSCKQLRDKTSLKKGICFKCAVKKGYIIPSDSEVPWGPSNQDNSPRTYESNIMPRETGNFNQNEGIGAVEDDDTEDEKNAKRDPALKPQDNYVDEGVGGVGAGGTEKAVLPTNQYIDEDEQPGFKKDPEVTGGEEIPKNSEGTPNGTDDTGNTAVGEMTKPGLYIVRHSSTSFNSADKSQDKVRGWKDVPLDQGGIDQAGKLAQAFSQLKVDKIIASDLSRCMDTAKIIGQAVGVTNIVPEPNFRSWNMGDFQGKSSADSMPELEKYAKEKPDENVPGGESFNTFAQRAVNALQKLVAEVKANPQSTTIVVTHYRDIKLFQAWVQGGSKQDYSIDINTFMSDDVEPCTTFYLNTETQGLLNLDKVWELEKEQDGKNTFESVKEFTSRVWKQGDELQLRIPGSETVNAYIVEDLGGEYFLLRYREMGNDIEKEYTKRFLDAYATKTSFEAKKKLVTCPTCKGDIGPGKARNVMAKINFKKPVEVCKTCKGKGKVYENLIGSEGFAPVNEDENIGDHLNVVSQKLYKKPYADCSDKEKEAVKLKSKAGSFPAMKENELKETEGSRRLTSPASLKDGEKSCSYCSGFGAKPVNKQDPSKTTSNPEKCSYCNGTGKVKESVLDEKDGELKFKIKVKAKLPIDGEAIKPKADTDDDDTDKSKERAAKDQKKADKAAEKGSVEVDESKLEEFKNSIKDKIAEAIAKAEQEAILEEAERLIKETQLNYANDVIDLTYKLDEATKKETGSKGMVESTNKQLTEATQLNEIAAAKVSQLEKKLEEAQNSLQAKSEEVEGVKILLAEAKKVYEDKLIEEKIKGMALVTGLKLTEESVKVLKECKNEKEIIGKIEECRDKLAKSILQKNLSETKITDIKVTEIVPETPTYIKGQRVSGSMMETLDTVLKSM